MIHLQSVINAQFPLSIITLIALKMENQRVKATHKHTHTHHKFSFSLRIVLLFSSASLCLPLSTVNIYDVLAQEENNKLLQIFFLWLKRWNDAAIASFKHGSIYLYLLKYCWSPMSTFNEKGILMRCTECRFIQKKNHDSRAAQLITELIALWANVNWDRLSHAIAPSLSLLRLFAERKWEGGERQRAHRRNLFLYQRPVFK